MSSPRERGKSVVALAVIILFLASIASFFPIQIGLVLGSGAWIFGAHPGNLPALLQNLGIPYVVGFGAGLGIIVVVIMALVGLVGSRAGRHVQAPVEEDHLLLSRMLLITSIAFPGVVVIIQMASNGFMPTGWDTPQYGFQPQLYLSSGLFPADPYKAGLVDTMPGLLLLLASLFGSNPILLIWGSQAVAIACSAVQMVGIYVIVKSVSRSTIYASLGTGAAAVQIGYSMLMWGYFQNIVGFALLTAGLAIMVSTEGVKRYLSVPLFLGALVSHDSVLIIFPFIIVGSWALETVWEKRISPTKMLRNPLFVSALFDLPFAIDLYSVRGARVLSQAGSAVSFLNPSDYVSATALFLPVSLIGVYYLTTRCDKRDSSPIAAFLVSVLLLSTPFFFTFQYQFLWMLSIPLSMTLPFALMSISDRGSGTSRRKVLSILTIGLLLAQVSVAIQFHSQSGSGFPGTEITRPVFEGIKKVGSFVTDPSQTVVVTPSQYNAWLISLDHVQVLPYDQSLYSNMSLSQWIQKLVSDPRYNEVLVFATSGYSSFINAATEMNGCPLIDTEGIYLFFIGTCSSANVLFNPDLTSKASLDYVWAGDSNWLSFGTGGLSVHVPSNSTLGVSLKDNLQSQPILVNQKSSLNITWTLSSTTEGSDYVGVIIGFRQSSSIYYLTVLWSGSQNRTSTSTNGSSVTVAKGESSTDVTSHVSMAVLLESNPVSQLDLSEPVHISTVQVIASSFGDTGVLSASVSSIVISGG